MIALEFTVFAVILGAYALWVFGMYIAALKRGLSWRKRDQISKTLQPQIREALVDYMAGSDDITKIRQFLKESRSDVGTAVLAFQSTVGGAARDRLCELALEQALVHDWCEDGHSRDVVRRRTAFARLAFVSANEPCRRVSGEMLSQALNDEDSEVRFSAALAVLQAGAPRDVDAVFDLAVSHNRLVRILLAEELRRHVAYLCKRAIPKALASEDHDTALATLEMLNSWERALPLEDLRSVLRSPIREIRLHALRLTSLVPLTPDTQLAILDSLSDPDVEIAQAACHCAGRLHIQEAVTGLAGCLRRGSADLARAAAAALVEIPPVGWTILEELAGSPNTVTANAAREGLAKVREKADE